MSRLALTALFALSTTGCIAITGDPFDTDSFSDAQRLTFDEPIDAVEFEVGSGSFELSRGDVGEAVVERVVRWGNEPPDLRAEVRGGTLFLTAVCPPLAFQCATDHVVVLPADARVSGSTGSGDIQVRDNGAEVSVSTGSGTIRLLAIDAPVAGATGSGDIDVGDVGGDADLATGSGSIRVDGLGGDLFAETASGDLTVIGAAGDLVLDSGSGSIRGSGLDARSVLAGTGSGDVDLDFVVAPMLVDVATGSGSVHFGVPAGDYDLDLETGSGSITVLGVDEHEECDATLRARTGSGDIRVLGD